MAELTSKIVLFADVAGSMEIFAKMGVVSATDVIGNAVKVCSDAIAQEDGKVVKLLGDGVLAIFSDAGAAARAALEIQRLHDRGDIRFKIGIDAGMVIDTSNDVFGDAVGLASRLSERAHAGEIFASAAAAANMPDEIGKSDQSELWLKGYPKAVNVYSIEANLGGTRIVYAPLAVATQARLTVPDGDRVFIIGKQKPSMSIGREQADLIIPREWVSRQHAAIKWSPGDGFVLHDMSRNGTYIQFQGGEVQRIHRDRASLYSACFISLGREPSTSRYDLSFEALPA